MWIMNMVTFGTKQILGTMHKFFLENVRVEAYDLDPSVVICKIDRKIESWFLLFIDKERSESGAQYSKISSSTGFHWPRIEANGVY